MINRVTKKEYAINVMVILMIFFVIGQLFYGVFYKGLWMVVLLPFVMKKRKQQILKNKQRIFESQFKNMLVSLSDALLTGYSLENALHVSYKDMVAMYGHQSEICVELRLMISRLKLNVSVEMVFCDFAERTELEEVQCLSQMILLAKRTGGDLVEIIKNTAENIVLKERVRTEIQVTIHEKRMEQKIMLVIPAVLIVFVSVTSPGFLNVMYESIMGWCIMTVFIVLYIVSYIWAEECIRKGEEW